MKKYLSIINTRLIITAIVLMMSFTAMAQAPDPLDDDPGAPIDGGVSILIAAGVGYGAKKVQQMRKKKNTDDAR